MKIDFTKGKKKLAILWFTFVAAIFVLMFLQTLGGKFGERANEAWGWLFSAVLPTLSLIITIFVMDVKSVDKKAVNVDVFYFRLVFYLSLFYLSLILVILLIEPIPWVETSIIQLMKDSSMYIGPLQGLVSASVGIFFIKKQ